METMPNLRTALLDLLYETSGADLRLIIGGGYGIFLKREIVRQQNMPTLLREWPEARSTNDLDLFLRPELLINSAKLKPLAEALNRLGYQIVPGAEKFQFFKPAVSSGGASLKIDLLTGPRSSFAGSPAKTDDRRVRPRPAVDLHAHHVDEALTLEVDLLSLPIVGKTSHGFDCHAEVYLPHPLTFLTMKLFAFGDRLDDLDKDYGRYHALDLYAVLATMSEAEWDRANDLRKLHGADPVIRKATAITHRYFSSLDSEGMIRMRESPYCRKELQLEDFCTAICELFSTEPREDGHA